MSKGKKSDIAFFNGRNKTRNNQLSSNEIFPVIDKNNICNNSCIEIDKYKLELSEKNKYITNFSIDDLYKTDKDYGIKNNIIEKFKEIYGFKENEIKNGNKNKFKNKENIINKHEDEKKINENEEYSINFRLSEINLIENKYKKGTYLKYKIFI